MSEIITVTAYQAWEKYQHLLESGDYLIRAHSNRQMWTYYDRIDKPGNRIRIQRAYHGAFLTNYWEPDRLVDLVPADQVPDEYLPDRVIPRNGHD